jgi:hypothetical protein
MSWLYNLKISRTTSARMGRVLLLMGLSMLIWTPPSPSAGASGTGATWASLGTLTPSAVQSSQWGSAVDATSTSSTYAWCGTGGIDVVQSNGLLKKVSDAAVEPMLTARALNINHTSKVVCDLVVSDPLNPNTIYAGFEAGQNYSIPPVATVAMYTRNDGATWHFIPPPAKMTYLDFGGFALRGDVVQAVFTNDVSFARPSSRWSIDAEVEGSDGAWNFGSLACPTAGPCVTFGPQIPQGACGMSSWQQALLVAVPGSISSDPVWQGTTWVEGIPECDPALLFSDQHGDEYLLDFAMRHPLVRSVDGGYGWQPVELPLRDGHEVGGSPESGFVVTAMSPAGDLLVVIGPAGATTERLLLLAPGATQWCLTRGVLPTDTRTDPIGAMGVTASRLVMLQEATTGLLAQGGLEHSVPLSALRCAN